MRSRLTDSALILAILGGIFFAVGHVVEIRRAKDYGIDLGLMPVLPTEAVLFRGAIFTLLLLLIPALLIALIAVIVKVSWLVASSDRRGAGTSVAPPPQGQMPAGRFWEKGSLEVRVALAIVIVLLAMINTILYAPMPRFSRSPVATKISAR